MKTITGGAWAVALAMSASSLGVAGCDRRPADGLGTSVGHPLLLGLEQGSELHVGSLEADPVRVRLDTVSGDATYHTNWTLGEGACLEVQPRTGPPVMVTGSPIAADYYHLGRLLVVSVGEEGQTQLASFIEPNAYRTVPCPAEPAAATAQAPAPARAPNE